MRVLLVEDNAELRGFLQQTLMEANIESVLASNGAEALKQAETEKFDAFVLASDFGDTDGITLVGKLRALKNGRGVPVVLMGTVGTALARRMAQAAGCNLFLAKPFGPAPFVEGIRGLSKE